MDKLTICGLVGKSNKGPFNKPEIIDSSDGFYEIFGFPNISIERRKKLNKIIKKIK